MANSNVASSKLERNTLLTRFLISSNFDDRGVCADGEDDIAADDAADDPDADANANVAVGFDDDGDSADEDVDATADNTANDDAATDDDADDDPDVAVGFDDDDDDVDEDTDAPTGSTVADDAAADDSDADPVVNADVAVGFDDDRDTVDEVADAWCGCDEDDGNGEGEINDRGDCNVDCSRTESWRIFNCQDQIDTKILMQRILKEYILFLFRIFYSFSLNKKRVF